MVKFIEIDPEEIPNFREPHRGRISYPILKSFLELDKPLVMLDRTGMQQSLQSLYSSLSAYIRSHDLPIKLFNRQGQVYLIRLDLDDKGNPIKDWQEKVKKKSDKPVVSVTSDEVKKRFVEEKDKVTK